MAKEIVKEILADLLELQSPIEIIAPTITRYQVGGKFSKIVFDPITKGWKVYSRKSTKVGLVGANNVKGVVYKPEPKVAPAPEPEKKPDEQ